MKVLKPLILVEGEEYTVYYNNNWGNGFYIGDGRFGVSGEPYYAFRRQYGIAYIAKNEIKECIKR